MSFENLNADMLMNIFTKVDKYEHLRLLIDTFKADEITQLKSLINEARNKIQSFRSVSFQDLKGEYRKLMTDNRKKKEDKMLSIDINLNGKDTKIYITKFGTKYVYGYEIKNNFQSNWKIITLESLKNVSVVDDPIPEMLRRRQDMIDALVN
jgi:hypothetical protein